MRELSGVALTLVKPHVDRVETDIPLSRTWPAEVLVAAERLLALPSSTLDRAYGQTGILDLARSAIWQDFAAVAPFAYDASVWSVNEPEPILSLADGSDSIVLFLTAQQRQELGRVVGLELIERRVRGSKPWPRWEWQRDM